MTRTRVTLTSANDDLIGSFGADTIQGQGGNDVLVGQLGADDLRGGDGNDRLYAGWADGAFDLAAGQVVRLYGTTLGRSPDAMGQAHWTKTLTNGQETLRSLVRRFTDSKEFKTKYGATDDETFVTLLYRNTLGREPDAAGLAGWVGLLESGQKDRAGVVLGFSESREMKGRLAAEAADQSSAGRAMDFADDVYRIYRGVLGRDPDEVGLQGWCARLATGEMTIPDVIWGFVRSAEFKTRFGALEPRALVERLYDFVLDRAPDESIETYVDQITLGEIDTAELVRRFVQSREFKEKSQGGFDALIDRTTEGSRLDGGAGDDEMVGSLGADRFSFGTGFGHDRVLRFDADQGDVLDLSATGLAFSDLTIRETAGGSVITTPEGVIEVAGVTGLDESAFQFDSLKPKASSALVDSDSVEGVSTETYDAARGATFDDYAPLIGMDGWSGYDGSGQTVVIIDTGIDQNLTTSFGVDANSDGIADRILAGRYGDAAYEWSGDDRDGHGTHIASIIGSENSAHRGIAPGVNIISLKVIPDGDGGTVGRVEDALAWVVQNGAAYNVVAVNLSLSATGTATGPTRSVLSDEIDALTEQGVITVVAAGNGFDGTAAVSSLATDPDVVAVGALWAGDFGAADWGTVQDASSGAGRVAGFSARNGELANLVFAPGAGIEAASVDGTTRAMAGTSQAAAIVTGIAALAQEIAQDVLGRHLSPAEFLSLLRSSADVIRDDDDEDSSVAGLGVDLRAVNMAALTDAIKALATTGSGRGGADATGNTVATAGQIGLNQIVEGAIDYGVDTDWHAIKMTAGVTYQIDLKGISLTDPVLHLMDSSGAVVAFSDDATDGSGDARLTYSVATNGTYYAVASSYGDATGDYRLTAKLAPEYMVDDFASTLRGARGLEPGEALIGRVETVGDRDWFAADLEAGGLYRITSDALTLVDTTVKVRDASGRPIHGEGFNQKPGGTDMLFHVVEGGRYYFDIGSFDPNGVGSYTMSYQLVPETDAVPGDTTTQVTLTEGQSYVGKIDAFGDTDWIRVTVPEAGLWSAKVADPESPNSNPGLSVVSVYDDNGALYRKGHLREGRFDVAEPGTYYLEIAHTVLNTPADYFQPQPSYRITFDRAAPVPPDPVPDDASTTQALTLGEPKEVEINNSYDRDSYAVQVEAGKSYVFTVVPNPKGILDAPWPYTSMTSGDLELRRADGSAIGWGSPLVDYFKNLSKTQMYFTASEDETLYLSVGDSDHNSSGWVVVLADEVSPDDLPHGLDPKARIAPGDEIQGRFDHGYDVDSFRLSVEPGVLYNISSDIPSLEYHGAIRHQLTDSTVGPISYERVRTVSNDGEVLTWVAFDKAQDIILSVGSGLASPVDYRLSVDAYPIPEDDAGDTPAGAKSVSVGDVVESQLGAVGDVDYFQVDVKKGEFYEVAAWSPEGRKFNLSVTDPAKEFYDNLNWVQKIESNVSSTGQTGVSNHFGFVPDRDMTVLIKTDTSGVIGLDPLDVRLQVSATTLEAASGDRHPGGAESAETIAPGANGQGRYDFAGDEDWFRIDASAGDTVQVVNRSGQVKLYWDGPSGLVDLGHVYPRDIPKLTTQDGQFYLKAFGGVVGQDYSLEITYGTAPIGSALRVANGFADVVGDTAGDAQALAPNTPTLGLLIDDVDKDAYRFVAPSSGLYLVATEGSGTRTYVYDASGVAVGKTYNTGVAVEMTAGDVYTAIVSGYDAPGTYNVSVSPTTIREATEDAVGNTRQDAWQVTVPDNKLNVSSRLNYADDVDWVRFDLAEGSDKTLSFRGNSDLDPDWIVALWQGDTLIDRFVIGDERDEVYDRQLTDAGTYYVEITSAGAEYGALGWEFELA